MSKRDLARFFDRVALINLKCRSDRLAQVQQALAECKWPFRQPIVYEAVDGRVSLPPAGKKFESGPSAWGCLCSHRTVLGQALKDGVRNLLVLEDDVCFAAGFRELVEKFLAEVPQDWDQLMLGGQHVNLHGPPRRIKPGVLQCFDCERTHCYAVRGAFMRKFHKRLGTGGRYNGLVHCDYIMGRDPDLQMAHQVYAPELFLAGQERSYSQNFKTIFPRQFWNPPGPELVVINLHAPFEVMAALREHGWFTGSPTELESGINRKLARVFKDTPARSAERIKQLRRWIVNQQWQVGYDPDFICTVWHPQATAGLVKSASLWPVFEVTADTVAEAMRQIPRRLRRACLPEFC